VSIDWKEIAQDHAREVEGNGRWPFDSEYLEEFVTQQARKSPEWAIAWALLQVGHAIRAAGANIGGVDCHTGIQKLADCAEAIATAMEKAK
jgi:hypothetical protein